MGKWLHQVDKTTHKCTHDGSEGKWIESQGRWACPVAIKDATGYHAKEKKRERAARGECCSAHPNGIPRVSEATIQPLDAIQSRAKTNYDVYVVVARGEASDELLRFVERLKQQDRED